jgi:tetratricopeptide (TPR) repeat protein
MRLSNRGLVVVMLLLLTATLASAQQRTFGLDEDPIRLGRKALYSGDLASSAAHFQEAIAADYHVDQAIHGLARVADRQRRLEDAEALYRQAIDQRVADGKEFPEARADLGLLLLRLARDAEADLEFTAALKKNDRLWAAQYGRALLLLRDRRWEEAKKLLDQGSKLKGSEEGEGQYHFGVARYFLGVEELDEAERHALLAFHSDPTDPEYGMLVGEIYERRESPLLAIDAFERALASPGMAGTAPMLHNLGGLYEEAQRFDEARDRYLSAVRADSTYAPALKSLAELYRRGRRPEQAARSYLRYVLLERNDIDALLGLAESCHDIGQYRQSVEAAQAVLKLEARNEQARFEFARSGIHLRDPELRLEAIAAFATLSSELPWSAEDIAAVASFEIARKNFPRAQDALTRGFASHPDAPELHFQQGILALHSKDVDVAVEHLRAVSAARPDFLLAHLNLGIAYLQGRRVAEAIEPLQRAVEIDGTLTAPRLLLAQALAGSERLEEAAKEYRVILDGDPASAPSLRGLAFCSMRRSDFTAAAEYYARATAVEPQDVEGWAGLGNAQLGLQDLAKAEEAFRKASALDPNHPTTIKGLQLLEQYKQSNNGG